MKNDTLRDDEREKPLEVTSHPATKSFFRNLIWMNGNDSTVREIVAQFFTFNQAKLSEMIAVV